MNGISTNYTLEIEVLSPLHVGNGHKLQRDLDFVAENGVTYRLNQEAILNELWPEDEADQQRLLSGTLANLLKAQGAHLSQRPELALYSYRGDPAMNEIYEHIKDVFGRAYLPGSSLKGALRTALMRTMIEGVSRKPITRDEIGRSMRDPYDSRAAKEAGHAIERRYGGFDPNHDLFRILAVGDSAPAPKEALTLQRLQMVPELDVDVEVIHPGTHLSAPVRVDAYLASDEVAQELRFDKRLADTVRRFIRAAQFTAEARIRQELGYHADRDEPQPTSFYYELLKQIEAKQLGPNQCLIQVGFATGWRAKAVIGGLSNDDSLLEEVVTEFELDRGGRGQGGRYERGQTFPKARHLAYRGQTPALPMGWLKLTATRRDAHVQDG